MELGTRLVSLVEDSKMLVMRWVEDSFSYKNNLIHCYGQEITFFFKKNHHLILILTSLYGRIFWKNYLGSSVLLF